MLVVRTLSFMYLPFLYEHVVGGLGFEFCVFVVGWRHALQSEWPLLVLLFPHSCLITPCPTHCSPAHANQCRIRMHRLITRLITV